jgi:hypothetical protein
MKTQKKPIGRPLILEKGEKKTTLYIGIQNNIIAKLGGEKKAKEIIINYLKSKVK